MTEPSATRRHQPSFVFEVTQRCNHDCPHCYNAWKNPVNYPLGELGTAETLAMLAKILDETGAGAVSLSGGEPLLRHDLCQIVEFLLDRQVTVNLVSNGSLLDAMTIGRLCPDKISMYELPLLSSERDIHDRMSGVEGAFDRMTLVVADLKAVGQRVVGVFVATKLNLHTWRETAELGFALGLDGMMFNRFNPGGRGYQNLEFLQASPDEIQQALDAADQISVEYDFPIHCSIAMPPCLFDVDRYERLRFGFCAAGTERAYYTLDPLGNLRPCNHSPRILGNIREQTFWELADCESMAEFCSARPAFCKGCHFEITCQGGCKAAAEACCSSATAMDPFLAAFFREPIAATGTSGGFKDRGRGAEPPLGGPHS